jgi:hypothetical protein
MIKNILGVVILVKNCLSDSYSDTTSLSRTFYGEKDLRTKMHCKKIVVQYFTFLGKEHYHEGMFHLVKGWISDCYC